jgi:hypothetical protein
MSIIKIEGGPLAGYNGEMVGVQFEDGVSVESVSPQMINRLAAVMNIVIVETGEQAGVAANLVKFKGESFEEELAVAEAETEVEFTEVSEEIGTDGAEQPATALYTKEDLEAIADKSGIAGVREVGDKFGVKGTSIGGIINGIIEAQNAGQ